MPRDRALAFERGADDAHAKMAAAVARAGVTGMAMALVLDVERIGLECRGEAASDRLDAPAHGYTLRNGCTRTSRKTPAAMYGSASAQRLAATKYSYAAYLERTRRACSALVAPPGPAAVAKDLA